MYSLDYYDILSYLGDSGGILKVILASGFVLSGLFASRIFSAAIVKETYKLQKYMKNNDDYYNLEKFIK